MPTLYIDNKKDLPKRKENDFYPTPYELCEAVLVKKLILIPRRNWIAEVLDPGAGGGVWGKAVRIVKSPANITGVELRNVEKPVYYDTWYKNTDFLSWETDSKYTLIIGNPPYKHSEEFIDKSLDLLEDKGWLVFLLKLSLLESKKRYSKYYSPSKGLNPKQVLVSTRRVSFTGDRKSNADAYGIFVWEKGWLGKTTL